MLYDHVDLRVSDLAKARLFYDPLMAALGCTSFDAEERQINYHPPTDARAKPFFGLMERAGHRGDASRLAFRANSRADVDRLAKVAFDAGALAFESPAEFGEGGWYYAAFFEDADGNKLEICFRE
jgi:predicted lactoylglutathione lyase